MPAFTLVGQIPSHIECYIDKRFTHGAEGFSRAMWFGLVGYPCRAWGITVLLESGAIYRNLPPHAIAFDENPGPWTIQDAQTWDVYSWDWTALHYELFREHRCKVKCADKFYEGEYLFTVAPVGDAWSAYPEQNKEFYFIRLDNGRLTIQPTNRVLFEERAFTARGAEWPKDLRRQTEVWSCE